MRVDTWDTISSRRNVRSYLDRPIPEPDLHRIMEAGRRAPSSKNTQPWDFVLVTRREHLVELATVWQGAGHIARSAATVALIAPVTESGPQRAEYDLGQVTMSMMLAATDLGIGTGHSAVGDQDLARTLLGLPADRRCAYLIAFGYPADRPLTPISKPARRAFDDVVHRERW
ncbi:MAG TPA: nitroreductase family protein [Pseudonocardiaceae bacterium]|nr:nitroreductase family protein [Pseudonocardiaceae bacterium]